LQRRPGGFPPGALRFVKAAARNGSVKQAVRGAAALAIFLPITPARTGQAAALRASFFYLFNKNAAGIPICGLLYGRGKIRSSRGGRGGRAGIPALAP